MSRPTTRDLAAAAGVSLATVDRVLNARSGVRQKTVDKVTEAIEAIGFVRDFSAASLARGTEYRFVFVLPDVVDQFVELISRAIDEANKSLIHERTNVSILRVPANDPHAIADELLRVSKESVDGIAIMAPETPQVRDAISRLRLDGMAVVAFVSSQPNAEGVQFIGINNEAAGRTAGRLMERFTGDREGSVLVMAETIHSRDSLERRLGFDKVMAEASQRLSATPSMETYNDNLRTQQIIGSALHNFAPVVGIYLMSHDVAEPLNALKAIDAPEDLVVIGHELTDCTRNCLIDGSVDAVITQDVGHLVRSSIRVLRASVGGIVTVASQERIRIEIILQENMPDQNSGDGI